MAVTRGNDFFIICWCLMSLLTLFGLWPYSGGQFLYAEKAGVYGEIHMSSAGKLVILVN